MVSRRDFLAAPLAIATAAAFLRAAPQHRSVKLGCQTNAWRIDPNNFDSLLEVLRQIAERLILSGGGLTQNGQFGQLDLKNKVDGLNAAGRDCKSKGLRLAYHNHGPEFLGGGQEIESLARLTDPELVDFLLDCGWAFRAQADVPVFFTNHHLRVCGLHLRDFKNGEQVPLGQGEFPIRELAAVIKKVNWTGWAIIEEERLSGEKQGEMAVAPARQTLKQVFGR